MKYCFGVDIGGTTVKIGLFTTEGELLEKWEIKTRTENHGEAILPDLCRIRCRKKISGNQKWMASGSGSRLLSWKTAWYKRRQILVGDTKKLPVK